MKPFHEIGQRYATELRPGNVNVTGTIGRAHVNGALLKLMLGDGAAGTRPAGAFVSPTFNLSLRIENPALPGNTSTVTVHSVKLDELELRAAGGRLRARAGDVPGAVDQRRGRRAA